MGKKHSFMLLQICFARSERSGIPVFFFSFLLFFTKSRAFNDNFQKKKRNHQFEEEESED